MGSTSGDRRPTTHSAPTAGGMGADPAGPKRQPLAASPGTALPTHSPTSSAGPRAGAPHPLWRAGRARRGDTACSNLCKPAGRPLGRFSGVGRVWVGMRRSDASWASWRCFSAWRRSAASVVGVNIPACAFRVTLSSQAHLDFLMLLVLMACPQSSSTCWAVSGSSGLTIWRARCCWTVLRFASGPSKSSPAEPSWGFSLSLLLPPPGWGDCCTRSVKEGGGGVVVVSEVIS